MFFSGGETRTGPHLNTFDTHSGDETDRPGPLGGDSLGLQVQRPHSDALVVIASGEIEEATVARMEEMLFSRLEAAVRMVVLDLTGVEFLGVAALQLLGEAGARARERGVELALVATDHEVLRALHTAELHEALPVRASARAALSKLDDQADPA